MTDTRSTTSEAGDGAAVRGSEPRLLIVAQNLALLHGHYEAAIVGLARAGVRVSIRYLRDRGLSLEEYRESLSAAGVAIDVAPVERLPRRGPERLALRLRELGNILRFTHPDYSGKDVLSARAFEKKTQTIRRIARFLVRLGPTAARTAAALIASVEAAVRPPRWAVELIEREQPTTVAAAAVIRVPLLVDFLKAAAADGRSTAIWVQSWDNLTNKGLLHFVPDRVFVWNDRQCDELARYHGVPADRVCATGAQTFDHWFNGAPIPERAEFCAAFGVDPEKPIILYLASSRQIAPQEPVFFADWLRAVRQSGDPVLESATILIRPHPTMVEAWSAAGFDREEGVVVSPATRRDRLNSAGFREQYRGELHHATVAFGINTSGLIDAAIFGKPTCTVELPELYHGQRGTVHFQHLVRPEDGLLRTDSSMADHLVRLGELVRRETYDRDERSVAFVRAFVRPHGIDRAPTDVFVEAMLEVCRSPAQAVRSRGVALVAARLLEAAAVVAWVPLNRKQLKRYAILARRIRRAFVLAALAARHALRSPGTRSRGRADDSSTTLDSDAG